MASAASETPDCIGWNSFRSILIECKASRADFKRDAHKSTRIHDSLGMGSERFYMAPAGMIQKEELPAGWGLLEVKPDGKVRMKKDAEGRMGSKEMEVSLLISAIRRIGQNPPEGVSVKCYTLETKRHATITIDPEQSPSKESP